MDHETSPILWSPGTRGFYLRGISAAIPEDARPLERDIHASLLHQQTQGATIEPCSRTGRPRARHERLSIADRRAALAAAVKNEARRRIDAVSPAWRQINDLRAPSMAATERFAAIDAIRAASAAIEKLLAGMAAANLDTFPIAEHPLWPKFQDSVA
ncbi:hypothetical protein SAMN05518801_10739 [Novosphingobium sp. CF614]|uniref:hypothetical protein n=1 Tax=Novosphingobium sp. CF614 TaxID=1884364 RepID=UPI0008E6C0C6|nr:hypothetical protein [Novosphingobium sp. CF614]SFG08487.1 hypothetical protein SAMN05518801_10739 [Novosphingobium sp. CF614]